MRLDSAPILARCSYGFGAHGNFKMAVQPVSITAAQLQEKTATANVCTCNKRIHESMCPPSLVHAKLVTHRAWPSITRHSLSASAPSPALVPSNPLEGEAWGFSQCSALGHNCQQQFQCILSEIVEQRRESIRLHERSLLRIVTLQRHLIWRCHQEQEKPPNPAPVAARPGIL